MIESLTVMARGFEEDGLPLQSIQCLIALVSTSLVPEAEVRARLHLSRLLLEHTLNAQEAKKHLQKAVGECKLQACVDRHFAATLVTATVVNTPQQAFLLSPVIPIQVHCTSHFEFQ